MNKTTLNRQKEKHSMLSLRRATSSAAKLLTYSSFLSTLSLRRATYRYTLIVGDVMISIHALLAESDYFNAGALPYDEEFLSTLSLRRATHGIFQRSNGRQFLSTLSLRRATGCWPRRARPSCYFYPRSPCGERPRQICQAENQSPFLSTLSLRRATHYRRNADRNTRFLSTLSLRRATALRHVHRIKAHISIHALLAESDAWPVASYATGQIFLSTLSLRRATLPL